MFVTAPTLPFPATAGCLSMMFIKRVCNRAALLVVTTACVFSVTVPAGAALPGGPVSLSFGASYVGQDGVSRTHRGVDVSMPPGETVGAPRGGTVKFAGRVPGAGGGTVLCVTLQTSEGLISLLPLERLDVGGGDTVEAGGSVGTLAPSGDVSSPDPHLHVGLRRGDLYVDPCGLLAAPAAEQPGDGTPSEAPAPTPAGGSAPALAHGDPVATGSLEPAHGVSLGDGVTLAASAPHAAAQAVSARIMSTRAARADVHTAAQPLSQGVALSAAVPVTTAVAGADPVENLKRLTASAVLQVVAAVRGAGWPALAVLGVALITTTLMLGRRALERQISVDAPVSDRLGTLLQHVWTGATICGLTSCSGLLPSQSRSRIAQRR